LGLAKQACSDVYEACISFCYWGFEEKRGGSNYECSEAEGIRERE